MKKDIICIMCPNGCRISVDYENGKVNSAEGYKCPKGADYATSEIVNPVRVLTATMKAEGCERPFAVKSSKPIPKSMMRQAAAELKNHKPAMPIKLGDTVIKNILGTGADIIATQDLA